MMSTETTESGSETVEANTELTDGGVEFPTTAIPCGEDHGIPSVVTGTEPTKQRRLVGNVFVGQVMVNWDGYEYDRDETSFEGYTGHTWEITAISEDSRTLTIQKRDGEDEGRERRLSVAELAREHIRDEQWMFLKDELTAVTWTHQGPSTRCQNCGVTRDNALSREEHFDAEMGGKEWSVTLRRCVGCGMFGTEGLAKNHNHHGQNKFTTGVLEGPDAPLGQD